MASKDERAHCVDRSVIEAISVPQVPKQPEIVPGPNQHPRGTTKMLGQTFIPLDDETRFTVIGADLEMACFVEMIEGPTTESSVLRYAPMDGPGMWRTRLFYADAIGARWLQNRCRPLEAGTPIRWVIAAVVGESPYQVSVIEIVRGTDNEDEVRIIAQAQGISIEKFPDL